MPETILRVNGLSIGIKKDGKVFTAVDNISFGLQRGEILGIVGESGCGKSLTALSIARLLGENIEVTGGSIVFDGVSINQISKAEMSRIQGKEISIIFQEPMTSLNPLMKVGAQIAENLKLHDRKTKSQVHEEVIRVLQTVGLRNPEQIMQSYPHQLSGGMRQRAMIAMAIICKPKLIIADEPTTALDVTLQAQILELLKSINKEYNTSILFISHDLGVVKRLCDRVAVMYAGRIVEDGSVHNIFLHPVHQYTKGLMGSIPTREKKGQRLENILGRVPPITEEKAACPFAPRCKRAQDSCFTVAPPCVHLSMSHTVRCILANEESEMEYVRI